MRLNCLAFAFLFSCLAAAHADDRLPIRDEAAQKEADALVRTVFGDEIKAATKPNARLALTKKLLEESAKPDTSPEGRYALLKAALDVAPDANVAMSVIDRMAKRFQIDELNAKAYTIKKISESASTPSERKSLAEAAVELADAYIGQDNFAAASALIGIALEAATKSRDSQLIRDIRAKKNDVSSLERKYADVKLALATLETDPTDAKSNLIAGRYKCFVKGKWEDGLPMLALGDDEALKALATKELMGAKASDEQVALADGWYDLAQKADEASKERMLQRASFWYQAALKSEPDFSRLVKAKVEKRLEEIRQDHSVLPSQEAETSEEAEARLRSAFQAAHESVQFKEIAEEALQLSAKAVGKTNRSVAIRFSVLAATAAAKASDDKLARRSEERVIDLSSSTSSVSIAANRNWQTAVSVTTGDIVILSAFGTWHTWPDGGNNWKSDAQGTKFNAGKSFPLPGAKQGALIGRIGSKVFVVGRSMVVEVDRDGRLELINNDDGRRRDNKGSLTVKILLLR